MAALIETLTLELDSAAFRESIDALASALGSAPGLAEHLSECGFGSLVSGEDLSGLVRFEPIESAATGAGKFHGLRILPDQRYLGPVSAIVDEGSAYIASMRHEWPMLSVVARTATVADAGGITSAPGGGLA